MKKKRGRYCHSEEVNIPKEEIKRDKKQRENNRKLSSLKNLKAGLNA